MRAAFSGYGAVGRALALALREAGVEVAAVAAPPGGRGEEDARRDGMAVTGAGSLPLDPDLIVLAVPDDAIAPAAGRLAERLRGEHRKGPGERVPLEAHHPLAIHLSGRLGLAPLAPLAEAGWRTAAWHPVQSFTRGAGPEKFAGITIGITAGEGAGRDAGALAALVGARALTVREEDRPRYHHACVLAANFLPLLLALGARRLEGIVEEKGEGEGEGEGARVLLPLVRGMVDNMRESGPAAAVTGPVARDDLEAVLSHLESETEETYRRLYRMLTCRLVDLAEEAGRMEPDRARVWRQTLGER